MKAIAVRATLVAAFILSAAPIITGCSSDAKDILRDPFGEAAEDRALIEAARAGDPPTAPDPVADAAPVRFLWKPVSESDGNAVVLTSADAPVRIAGVETGAPQGAWADDPEFYIYQFDLPGAEYGEDVIVTQAGNSWTIPNGDQRYEDGY